MFQGLRGATGVPGPVGTKGEQVSAKPLSIHIFCEALSVTWCQVKSAVQIIFPVILSFLDIFRETSVRRGLEECQGCQDYWSVSHSFDMQNSDVNRYLCVNMSILSSFIIYLCTVNEAAVLCCTRVFVQQMVK